MVLKTAGEPDLVQKVKADELESDRGDFLKACVGTFPKDVGTCLLNSKTLPEMKMCQDG